MVRKSKFLPANFCRVNHDQILAHDFGLNSFSAKIYFGRYIARSLYLSQGFIVSIRMKEHFGCLVKGFQKMEGRLKRYRRPIYVCANTLIGAQIFVFVFDVPFGTTF